jgi:hypothetical protein
MKATWKAFHAYVRSAKELVVVGYSLPGTDCASIEMFRHWAGLSGGRKVLLFEPSAGIAARYRAILKVPVKVVCRDFATFDPRMLD